MALPSQGGFTSSRGGSYRRRRKGKRFSWLIAIVIALGASWLFWPSGNDTEPNTEPRASTNTEVIATPPVYSRTVPPIEKPNFNLAQAPDVPEEVVEEVVEVVEEVVEDAAPIPTEVAKEEPALQVIPLASTTSLNLEEGMQLLDKGQLVQARLELSNTLRSGTLTETEEAQAKGVLTGISDSLVFSNALHNDDPYTIEYIVKGGDTLSGIVSKMGLQVDWRFIQRINGIKRASSIRPKQSIKLITGPFHAVVDKPTYRIDLYLGEGSEQVFVRSYRVGLGEFDSTPTGLFQVRNNSKLVNPTWINPRSREFYSADNPDNPIGERWIGLKGVDAHTKDYAGLGIHGTVEPQTIGTQASMGCIRMYAEDVTEVYEMLSEGVSTVDIK
jgi:lipoprotein-anchoring transpeptidase ErfK/SrfK